jgi:predicted ATP-grasp superfamily ATP-dependent carboligase
VHGLDALVLDAELRQSLVCVRSLGRAGLDVAAGGRRATPAGASRWCARALRVPDVSDDASAFVERVLRIVERLEPRVVFASHDGTIDALRPHRAALGATLALTSEAALAAAASKTSTYAAADRIGVRRPRGLELSSADAAGAALREIPPPVVIKPDRSWLADGGRRVQATVAVDAADAERLARGLIELGARVLVQEWVPGRREAVSLLRQEGEVRMRFAQVAHRMAPPLGGSSVLRESIRPPADVSDAAERLAAELGLDGYSEIEFRRDADGRAVLMEVNARLSASVEVAVRAGVDFPLGLHTWAMGGVVPAVTGYREGLRMRWLGGDLSWLWRTFSSQGMPDSLPAGQAAALFATDFLRPAAYDYATISDPGPAAVAVGQFVGDAVRSLPRRLRGARR